jgi:bacillopeptidase F
MKYLIFIFSLVSVSFAGYLTPELQAILDTLSNNVKTNVIVHLAEQGDLSVFPDTISRVEKINYLKGIAVRTQEPILYYLNSEGENVENVESFWLNNCISFSATKDVVINIVQREDVNFISDDFLIYIHDELIEGETSEWNINKVLADNCWRFGYTGLGIVVGSIDTGVDIFHLSLQGKWRSVDGWFDAISGTSIPNDAQGHGTHVMGIICGGDGFGPFENDIGIAPGVRFICAKAFDSYGQGQAMWIHSALQWVAGLSEPPQVLNNSWYSGRISTEYWNDCQNLKNLGVVTVFCIGEFYMEDQQAVLHLEPLEAIQLL